MILMFTVRKVVSLMNKRDKIEFLNHLLKFDTPVYLHELSKNQIFVKKEDAIPFSFGGNKVRIAAKYFIDLIQQDCDVVVTYGASSSNLCRVIANLAYKFGLKCIIVSPKENYSETPNSKFVNLFGTEIRKVKIDSVSETINSILLELKSSNHNPYFIYGGGHGKLGTESYREVLIQINEYEKENRIFFDKIFITLATGTSMSGLIVEDAQSFKKHEIIGVSVARDKTRADSVMQNALNEYKGEVDFSNSIYKIIDDYRCGGYGLYDASVSEVIKHEYRMNGFNLDTTYTGKGYNGMKKYLDSNGITNEKILFIHTGGTPLFFRDNLKFLEG